MYHLCQYSLEVVHLASPYARYSGVSRCILAAFPSTCRNTDIASSTAAPHASVQEWRSSLGCEEQILLTSSTLDASKKKRIGCVGKIITFLGVDGVARQLALRMDTTLTKKALGTSRIIVERVEAEMGMVLSGSWGLQLMRSLQQLRKQY